MEAFERVLTGRRSKTQAAYLPRRTKEPSMPTSGEAGVPIRSSTEIEHLPRPIELEPQRRGSTKTIGLCMIVKNESKIIGKCLMSALPLIDYILVVDTGSDDGTQQIIRDFLAKFGIRGAVLEEPWRDFAYNRTFALRRLREVENIDYAMIVDADDLVVLDTGFDPMAFKAQMEHDLYDVQVIHGGISHFRPHICSNRQAFSYKGVLHEYLDAPPGELSRMNAAGFLIRASTGGARSQNPRKYQDDAAILERVLATETDPFLISRYTFYLAQSYRDCGERHQALENYLKRAQLGYWNEEIYVSLLEAGNLMADLGRPFDEVLATYERAHQIVPLRAEALHAASLYCRKHGKNAEGREYARKALDLKPPVGALFVQSWIYDYGILDEFAINAYWVGAYRESLDASLTLLASEKLPPSTVKRIAANARFAAERLPIVEPPNLGRLGAENMVDQHKLVRERSLYSRVKEPPRVLVAILAKQKEAALPLYLECIEALDYPKSSIVLYIRTNNNTDNTEQILRDWIARVGQFYAGVEFDASNVEEQVEAFREHEWNSTRFKVLGHIRNQSLRRTIELGCEFYFVADVDNFVRRATLRELVALNLPIIAPLLRSISPERYYSNYHAEIDAAGYLKSCDQYYWILNRHIRGVVEVPVVHCTYLVRVDAIPQLTYADASERHEYVIFSDSARKAGIPQYLDNRQIYGYITFGEGEHHVKDGIERARTLLSDAGDSAPLTAKCSAAPAIGASAPIHLINLDRSTGRLEEFRRRNAHLLDVIRFPAIDGRALDTEKLIEEGVITRDLRYSTGALGCAMSHLTLWKMAVEEGRVITVTEDDAIFSRNFAARSKELLARLPADWDFVQWGWVFRTFLWVDPIPHLLGAKMVFDEGELRHNIGDFQNIDTVPAPMRLLHSFGIPCYSVSPKGARALLDLCLPLSTGLVNFPRFGVKTENEGVDIAMSGAYPSLNAFVSMPPLVATEHRTEDSTIRGRIAEPADCDPAHKLRVI
jgi:GR25 family glycosyltransferase involved in LPS biosynthesis/glycosyltransferase involved in cell wall biosynthesis